MKDNKMNKRERIWKVDGGKYYGLRHTYYFFAKKKDAETTLRGQGYKYSKAEKIFTRKNTEEWRTIDPVILHHEAMLQKEDI